MTGVRRTRWFLPLLGVLALPGCLDALSAEPAGFWRGLLEGALAPFGFMVSLFGSVEAYTSDNTGWPYALGFVLGSCATWVPVVIAIARVLLDREE